MLHSHPCTIRKPSSLSLELAPMLHAYRLLYRDNLDPPDSLWEWHQPWIDHLLWHARTLDGRSSTATLPPGRPWSRLIPACGKRPMLRPLAIPSGPPGTHGWSTTANCWSSPVRCTKATMASEERHVVRELEHGWPARCRPRSRPGPGAASPRSPVRPHTGRDAPAHPDHGI
jgi:hypothetical protein